MAWLATHCHFGGGNYSSSPGRWLQRDPIGFAGGSPNLYGYALQDPINNIDPNGLRPLDFIDAFYGPPVTPNPIDYAGNIQEAASMWPWNFYSAVKTGGKWDYKHRAGYGQGASPAAQTAYRNAGNYNYGLSGRAAGFSPWMLRRAAGAYQIYEGKSKPEWDWPWGNAPYGDDPIDQFWVNQGIKDFESGYFNQVP